MGSPGSEDRTYILSINIQDGKSFGPDVQAIACAATFAGETKLTSFSVGRDTHVWNATLQWRVTMDQFRRLTSLGQKDCKVVLSNKDGTKLGWFLVDVRTAKLQAQYKKTDGAWVTLTGTKKGDAPQVCMVALFYEDKPGVSFSTDSKPSPSKSRAAAQRQPTDSRPTGAAAGNSQSDPNSSQPENTLPDGTTPATTAVPLAAGTHPAVNPPTGLPKFGSPSRNLAGEGPFRHFALTLDVRSFQSSKRLPLSTSSVYVQAVLPADIIELVVGSGFRLPSRLAPLRSHPAVTITRGAEGAIPNGSGTLEFSAGVVQLARVLAREPRISVEAWHKERFRTDIMLGAGSVPLTPLLQGAWVDGYAPLFAVVATSLGGEVREECVQMGMMRVILSLEDKGPATPPGGGQGTEQPLLLIAPVQAGAGVQGSVVNSANAAAVQPPLEALRAWSNPYDLDASDAAPAGGENGAQALVRAPEAGELSIRDLHPAQDEAGPSAVSTVSADGLELQQQQRPQLHSRTAAPTVSLVSPPTTARNVASASTVRMRPALPLSLTGGPTSMLQGATEFEAAWELEVWKKAEEARWRTELREREAQRMTVLESEWRRREEAREVEVASLKAEYLALEDKAQQALAAAEARERRILAAEEVLLRRRKELEREHSARMTEAEAAVRRLQVECEHQLDIERDRNAELVRRVAALEERLAASDTRCLTVENEFADFRAAARSTPEAELARQLAEAQEAVKAAEARAAKAAKAKQGYKEQVRKLAEQMATLHQQRRRNQPNHGSIDDGAIPHTTTIPGTMLAALTSSPNASTIRAAAEDQARYAASQKHELAAMRAQLQAIKAAALAHLSSPGSPGRPMGGAGEATILASVGAPVGWPAAVDDDDEAADLKRSSDQQRRDHVQWSAGDSVGGSDGATYRHGALEHSGPGTTQQPDPNDTPMSRPAHTNIVINASDSSTSTAAAKDSTSSPTDSSSGRQYKQHLLRPVAVVPASNRSEDPSQNHGGDSNSTARPRQRWAAPQPSASAPLLQSGSNDQSALAAGHNRWSPGKAVSAPSAPVTSVSTSTSMTRTTGVAEVTATAAPQDRGLGLADQSRSDDGHWNSGRGRSKLQHQQLTTFESATPSAVVAASRNHDIDGDDVGGQGRSLADHLASSSYSVSRLREMPIQEQQSWDASAPQQLKRRLPEVHALNNWQLQSHQSTNTSSHPKSHGDVDAGYQPSVADAAASRGGGPDADLEELQWLTSRKVHLLQRNYDPDDPLVESLNNRIQALLAATAGLPHVRT